MSKHTPGPWYAFTVHSASLNPHCAYLVSGPTTRLMDRTPGFIKHDAELMAAAPDLLEALENLIKCSTVAGVEDTKAVSIYLAEAHAAIARAKGEQP